MANNDTAWKVSKCGVFCGPYFPEFGLNTERYSVSLHIQSKCGKIRTRKNSVFGHFSRSVKTMIWKKWKDISKDEKWKDISKDEGKRANFRKSCMNFKIADEHLAYKGKRRMIFDNDRKLNTTNNTQYYSILP